MQGSHWVAVYLKNSRLAYYFDSYAREPIPLVKKFLKQYKRVVKNVTAFQSILSETCGHYCIYFVFSASLGTPFVTIINKLSNHLNPDKYVSKFIKFIS
jgi:hypothetical protein